MTLESTHNGMQFSTMTKLPLGKLLVESDLISQTQLETALKTQETTGQLLGQVLFKLNFIHDESAFVAVLAGQLGVEHVSLKNINILPEAIAQISAQFTTYYKVMPIDLKNGVLTIAISNPLDILILDEINLAVNCPLEPVLAGERDILGAIRTYYGVGRNETRKSRSTNPTHTLNRPSCGRRFSAISKLDKILMRELMASWKCLIFLGTFASYIIPSIR